VGRACPTSGRPLLPTRGAAHYDPHVRSANPALTASTFLDVAGSGRDTMTLEGAVTKTGILLLLLTAAAGATWTLGTAGVPLGLAGMVAGLILALVTIFKKEWSPVTAPMYALAEGLTLGTISILSEMRFPGIAAQAVALTFGILFALLAAYRSGLISPTENFKLGIAAATGGIALVYLASFVLGFFGVSIPLIHESGLVGIGFSVFVVVIAALNLVLDFDFIEQGVANRAPRYMEWYAAFGLMVTLIWLYLEILNLLRKLNSRR
jgi:uncharacterized YccA/Bax inhibitor family protein